MSSIRKSFGVNRLHCAKLALSLAASLALVGCQTNPAPAPEPVSTEPLPIDEAMQARDWPRTNAEFQVANTVAGPTRFPYAPQTAGEGAGDAVFGAEASNAVLDTVFFIGQTLVLPFTYFVDPPFTERTPRGVIYDPTFTAMPVLPPDESPTPDTYDVPPAPVTETDTVAPADAPAEPAPDVPVDALETNTEPAPTPAPENVETPAEPAAPEPSVTPAPESIPPAPEVTEPAPTPEAAPEVTEPAPTPVPENAEPAPIEPAPTEPAPEAAEPAPTEPQPELTPELNK